MRLLKLLPIFMFVVLLQGFAGDDTKGATQQSGTITEISLEDRKITIGQTVYHLDDNLMILSNGNMATTDGYLENGKQIEFWVVKDNATGNSVIKKIRLLYDIKIQS